MAVHTKLSRQEIADFISANYQIGELVWFKEIIDGIDNSNFIIQTDVDKFIFTIFENRINQDELPFFMNLKLHLAEYKIHKICCPKPIKNNSGQLISSVKNKSAAIVSFLPGATLKPLDSGLYASITENHCAQIGQVSAKLHEAVLDFKEVRTNDLGILGWRNLFNKIADQIENYQTGLRLEISGYIDFLEKNWQNNYQSGAVHADLFPDNVFFDGQNNLSGVIDFYFAANDLFIYDLAVTINAWCFDENNKFDEKKSAAILAGYQKIKKLSAAELDFLKIALLGAALRFLLTRLHDLFFTPQDSLVKIKNPQEYLEKIRFFYKRDKIS
ncbi:MAG: homoserine kinase [Pseudomonadota bacterium]